MLRFTVEHKYCKAIRNIEGYNVWDALKNNGLDYKVWDVKEIERV
jgi:hypothetical protein